MEGIQVEHPIRVEELLEKYGVENRVIVNFQIGYDNNVWILLREEAEERLVAENGVSAVNTQVDAEYSVMILTVDWESGELLSDENVELGRHEMNYHYIQPIGRDMLLLGARTHYRDGNPEKNAVIVDKSGKRLFAGCFGDGIEDLIVTSDGRIITSYFDEGIFGNFGWDNPIGSDGLIIWNRDGEIVWSQKGYDIWDCYATNIDDENYLWFYYYGDFKLVKVDPAGQDTVYLTEITGANSFLITADGKTVLMDGGYDRHGQFFFAELKCPQIHDFKEVAVRYQGKDVEPVSWRFRGSRAVFVSREWEMFIRRIDKLG